MMTLESWAEVWQSSDWSRVTPTQCLSSLYQTLHSLKCKVSQLQSVGMRVNSSLYRSDSPLIVVKFSAVLVRRMIIVAL